MRKRILNDNRFQGAVSGWRWPSEPSPGLQITAAGAVLSAAAGKRTGLHGPGVHTRNGDTIELHFSVSAKDKGALRFGFAGGKEHAVATLDFRKHRVSLSTSDWTRPQPVASASLSLRKRETHVLLLAKTETPGGGLIKNADIRVSLDGVKVLAAHDLNILPEMGVSVGVAGTRLLLRRFVHRGKPSTMPETLHVGGWQMLNRRSIEENMASLRRGLRQAAGEGVDLLVTPETSLTGLPPAGSAAKNPRFVTAAEKGLRRFIRGLKNAPHLVLGFPDWRRVDAHRRRKTRYNAARVYDPDGKVISTCTKVHACEPDFSHGLRLNEFDILGVPVCMHICHDGRFPNTWTLPVMFGARLILHPANTHGKVRESIAAFEARANAATGSSHAFYLHVNGAGGSFLAGPLNHNRVMAVSSECRRDAPSFPMLGEPQEGLLHAQVRPDDSFGYWPTRAFRASETIAQAYVQLYRSMGGQRSGLG